MSWRTEWKAISNRISGLLEAGTFYFQDLDDKDAHSVGEKELLPHAKSIFECILEFKKSYENSLPPLALVCLKRYGPKGPTYLKGRKIYGRKGVQAVLTSLASLNSELSFILSDIQVVAKRITERGFIHLQRTLMVDIEVQEKWIRAFNDTTRSETGCEKFGAVHLLNHGIWAFKVDAVGGRTDLVLGEPVVDMDQIESSSEALVLTEWKIVRRKSNLDKKINEALSQASKYSAGVLAGFELAAYRYLVMVSESQLDMPKDRKERDIIYRHINISVRPKIPSK